MGDPADIRGWQRFDGRITTSGRLVEGDVARLAGIGVRHVINLALDDHPEALADEAALLADAGIGYTHIPVPFDAPDDTHYREFCAALDAQGDTPVHVHCIMNYRVSAFFYRLHREQGMDEGTADALMRRQWDPRLTDDPRTAVWSAFLAGDTTS